MLREDFVDYLVQERELVTVFLTNGVKLTGIIYGADDDGLILEREGGCQLVRWLAVATVMPQRLFTFETTFNTAKS